MTFYKFHFDLKLMTLVLILHLDIIKVHVCAFRGSFHLHVKCFQNYNQATTQTGNTHVLKTLPICYCLNGKYKFAQCPEISH